MCALVSRCNCWSCLGSREATTAAAVLLLPGELPSKPELEINSSTQTQQGRGAELTSILKPIVINLQLHTPRAAECWSEILANVLENSNEWPFDAVPEV